MKTSGNEVVKAWDDLGDISSDKLIKLRDVGKDNRLAAWQEYLEADESVRKIELELAKRGY